MGQSVALCDAPIADQLAGFFFFFFLPPPVQPGGKGQAPPPPSSSHASIHPPPTTPDPGNSPRTRQEKTMSAHPQPTSMRRPSHSHHSTVATNKDNPVGWAILGSANIAHKLWKAIHQSGCARVMCVASRSAKKAQAFIDECQALLPFAQAPDALEGYDAALAREDVACVYIPLPTAVRKEWVLKAAAAGKHVLVEKPVGTNAEDVKEQIQACIKHAVHFLDGIMFMHSARLPLLHHTLHSLGKLRRINTEFCFKADESFFESNIRCSAATEPLGCLGDLVRSLFVGTYSGSCFFLCFVFIKWLSLPAPPPHLRPPRSSGFLCLRPVPISAHPTHPPTQS